MELDYNELKELKDSEIWLQKVDEIMAFLRDKCVKAETPYGFSFSGNNLYINLEVSVARQRKL
jgi:hypothetical protein